MTSDLYLNSKLLIPLFDILEFIFVSWHILVVGISVPFYLGVPYAFGRARLE